MKDNWYQVQHVAQLVNQTSQRRGKATSKRTPKSNFSVEYSQKIRTKGNYLYAESSISIFVSTFLEFSK